MPDLTLFQDPRLIFLCRLLLGGIMLAAGLGKLSSRPDFEAILRTKFGLERKKARTVSRWLPGIEVIVGLQMVVGVFVYAACIALIILLAIFSLALIRLRLKGVRELSCNCFGKDGGPKRTVLLVERNLLLIIAGGFLYSQPGHYLTIWPARPDSVPASLREDALAIVFITISLFLCVLFLQGLMKVRLMRRDHDRALEALQTSSINGQRQRE